MVNINTAEFKIQKQLDSFVAFDTSAANVKRYLSYGTGTSGQTTCVCYNRFSGIYVCVKSLVTTFYYSYDGVVWTAGSTFSNTYYCGGIAYSDKLMIAATRIGGSNTPLAIYLYSSDGGISWISAAMPVGQAWKDVCYAPSLKIFVMVALSATYIAVYTTSWATYSITLRDCYSICWSEEKGLFVIATAYAFGGLVSSNGMSWSTFSYIPPEGFTVQNGARIIWASSYGEFILVFEDNNSRQSIQYSHDGFNWIDPSNGGYLTDYPSIFASAYWSNMYSKLFLFGHPISSPSIPCDSPMGLMYGADLIYLVIYI